MPKKKKLRLDSLSVTSFVTSEESMNVRGRGVDNSSGEPLQICPIVCYEPLTDVKCQQDTFGQPACGGTYQVSCGGTCEDQCTDDCLIPIETQPIVLCL